MPRLDEVDLRNEAAAAGQPIPRPTNPLGDMAARLQAMSAPDQEAFRRWVDPNYRQQAMDRALPPSMVEDRNAYLNAKREARQMQLEQQQRRMAEIEARRQQVQNVLQQINQTPATVFHRQGAAGIEQLQSTGGFVSEEQAKEALLNPKNPGEYRRARAYFDKRKQGVGLMETIQQNPVYQAARTEIPYAGQVASALKSGIEATAPVAGVLPQTALLQGVGEALPNVPTASGMGGAIAESSIPTEVWQAVIELIPGVGSVPDAVRMIKSGSPDALRALDNVLGSDAAQGVFRTLAKEDGFLRLSKAEPVTELRAGFKTTFPYAGDLGGERGRAVFMLESGHNVNVERVDGSTFSVDFKRLDDAVKGYGRKPGGNIRNLSEVGYFLRDIAAHNPDKKFVATAADARLRDAYLRMGFDPMFPDRPESLSLVLNPDKLKATMGRFARDSILKRLGSEYGGGPVGGPLDNLIPESKSVVPDEVTAGRQARVARIKSAIEQTRRLSPEQQRMISEQKSLRVAKAEDVLNEGEGINAVRSSRSMLAGEYDKPTFEPLVMDDADVGAIVDDIRTADVTWKETRTEQYFERLGALSAVEKSLMGVKPFDNEIDKLERFFPELADALKGRDARDVAGPARGLRKPTGLEDVTDRGGTQLHIRRSDPRYVAEEARREAEALAGVRTRHANELARLEQQRLKFEQSVADRAANPFPSDTGSTPMRLGADIEEQRQVFAEMEQSIRARHQAELARIARQKAGDEASREARRANPFPSDESALPERGLPPEPTGVSPMEAAPARGQQLRLSEAINEAYVGAIADSASPEEAKTLFSKMIDKSVQGLVTPLGLVKTVRTAFDVGWAGRQGWRLMPTNLNEWRIMFGKQFKAFFSEKYANQLDEATRSFVNFERSQAAKEPLAYLKSGTGDAAKSAEEYMSPLTKEIWGLSNSERGFVHPGNWFRQAVLDKQVRGLVDTLGRPLNDAEFQELIKSINRATLRGNTDWLGHNANTLGSLLFSLKGQVSGPQFLAQPLGLMARADVAPEVKAVINKQVGSYVAMGMSMLGLTAALGYGANKQGVPQYVKADLDWNSPTFGQVSVGGFRWNYWGADQPFVRYILAMWHGGEKRGGIFSPADRLRLTKNMVRSKLAPGIPSLAWDEFVNQGRNPYAYYGDNKINTPKGAALYALNQTFPIVGESGIQAYLDLGPAAIVPSIAANAVGLSTSTYQLKPNESAVKSKEIEKLGARVVERNPWPKQLDTDWQASGWDRLFKSEFSESLAGKSLSDFDNKAEVKAAYVEYWWEKRGLNGAPSEAERKAFLQSQFEKTEFATKWDKNVQLERLKWLDSLTPAQLAEVRKTYQLTETEKKALGIR